MGEEGLPDAPTAGRSSLGEFEGKLRFQKLTLINLSMLSNQVRLYPQEPVYHNLKTAVPKAARIHRDGNTLGEDGFVFLPAYRLSGNCSVLRAV